MRLLLVLAVFLGGLPAAAMVADGERAEAIFAGGCFWCMEAPFDELDGVLSTTAGYTGGHVVNPSYRQVAAGETGHVEALRVTYDPIRVSYEDLLEVFWVNVDPTDRGGQFCDRGEGYRAGIFYIDEEQRGIAEASLARLRENRPFKGAIVTEIRAASTFYPAEGYHQDYYRKNPLRYRCYRFACRRDARLQELWGER